MLPQYTDAAAAHADLVSRLRYSSADEVIPLAMRLVGTSAKGCRPPFQSREGPVSSRKVEMVSTSCADLSQRTCNGVTESAPIVATVVDMTDGMKLNLRDGAKQSMVAATPAQACSLRHDVIIGVEALEVFRSASYLIRGGGSTLWIENNYLYNSQLMQQR